MTTQVAGRGTRHPAVLGRAQREAVLVDTIRAEHRARSLRKPVQPLPPELNPTPMGEAISSSPWGYDIWFAVEFSGTAISVHRSGFGAETRYTVTDDGGAELSDRALGSIAARSHSTMATDARDLQELGRQARGHLVAIADAIAGSPLNTARSELRWRVGELAAEESLQVRSRGGLTR